MITGTRGPHAVVSRGTRSKWAPVGVGGGGGGGGVTRRCSPQHVPVIVTTDLSDYVNFVLVGKAS